MGSLNMNTLTVPDSKTADDDSSRNVLTPSRHESNVSAKEARDAIKKRPLAGLNGT